MKIQILQVPDCPGTAVLVARLAEITDTRIERRVVHSLDEAVALGMTGSPTMLVDGVDPFADGSEPSLACRLYRDSDGALSGSPSMARLSAVVPHPQPIELSTADRRPLPASVSAGRLALGPPPGAVGGPVVQGGAAGPFSRTAARQAALPDGVRAAHRAILSEFLATGRAPDRDWLRAKGITGDALDLLSTEDLVRLDGAGGVAVAYPFSGVPTGHRVRLAGGVSVWAMCAIDALGIPQLARRNGVIESVDPHTGSPIRVEAGAWSPAGAVVLVARSAERGPTSCCACPYMNFHASAASAQSYMDSHPELGGEVLDQPTAVELAGNCFASLLDP